MNTGGSDTKKQTHWRRHALVVAFVMATWILAWILDYFLMGPRSEGWVPINLRGFLAGPYVAATLVFAAVTTILVAALKPTRRQAVSIYFSSLVGVLALSALSLWIWRDSGEGNLEEGFARMSIEAQSLSRRIELRGWQPKDRTVDIELEVLEPVGSVEITVQARDAKGSVAAEGTTVAGRLGRGPTTISVPVEQLGTASGKQWRIRFLLRHEGTVADLEFAADPLESGGSLVGRRLPPPRSD